MKALSIRQPWAYLVAHGYKPVENRNNWQQPRFRGEMAIHASQSITRKEHLDCVDFVVSCSLPGEIPPYQSYPLGMIVAVVDVVDIIPPRGEDESYQHAFFRCPEGARDWWDQDQSGILVANVRRLTPAVRCKGMLGLWTVPPEIEAEVRGQL